MPENKIDENGKKLTMITLEELQQRWSMNKFTLQEVLREYPIKLYRPGDYDFPQTYEQIMSHPIRRNSWGLHPWVAKESEIEEFEREYPEITGGNSLAPQIEPARIGRRGQPECKERVRELASERLREDPELPMHRLLHDEDFWNDPRLKEVCQTRPAYVTFCKWLKGLGFREGSGKRPKKTS